MKDLCISREQSFSINEKVNDQGFAISNKVNHLHVFQCERQYNTGKAKVQIGFCSYVECFRRSFSMIFKKDIMCDKYLLLIVNTNRD